MTESGNVLVVDDEAAARAALAALLCEEGYSVETATGGLQALLKLQDFAPDCMIIALPLPALDGYELLQKALEQDKDCPVIVITACGAADAAVAALRAGAADYLTKPVHLDKLLVIVKRAIEGRRLKHEIRKMHQCLSERHRLPNLIGASPVMQAVFATVLQVAPSRASVLLSGESGTGKELIAAALHEHSPRAQKNLIKLHCRGLSETLLASELFGHERGAFTGAVERRDGRLRQADGGTLFLDEIDEIPPLVQVKLSRFLQEHAFEPVGANSSINVDVRIIAASQRSLREQMNEGKFREDLFYRLNVVSIKMPPLRQRTADIGLLGQHFLLRYAKEHGKTVPKFTDGAMKKMLGYHWPGNVHELKNAVERAAALCRGDAIGPQDLMLAAPEPSCVATNAEGYPSVPGARLSAIERFAIVKTLEHVGGSTLKAAKMLGVSPRTVLYKLQA